MIRRLGLLGAIGRKENTIKWIGERSFYDTQPIKREERIKHYF
jgi:hypothetical protein